MSVTRPTTAGIILYHYSSVDKSSSSSLSSSSPNEITTSLQTTLNTFLSLHLQSPAEKRIPIPSAQTISEWSSNDDYMIVVLYSRVVLEQNAGGLGMSWIQQSLLPGLMNEFILFKTHVGASGTSSDTSSTDDSNKENGYKEYELMNQCSMFNATFEAVYKNCETKGRLDKKMNYESSKIDLRTYGNDTTSMTNNTKSKKKKGKEGRVWHDSEQKVTSKTMAKLDRSKKDDRVNENDDPMNISDTSPALMEARAAYLPSDNEVPSWEQEETLNDDEDVDDDTDGKSSGWGSSLKGMMDQVSGKILTDSDLDGPLEEMEKMLTGKNVAREIAQDICTSVRKKLLGKRMASFTRVKTAVRQGLEVAIERILRPGKGRGGGDEVDLLRDVVSKRESGMMGKLLGASSEKKKPYVIVMGKLKNLDVN